MTQIIHSLLRLCGFGRTPKPPIDFQTKNPPDWVIDFKAQGLPYGRRHSIRVLLNQNSGSGRVKIQYSPRKYDKIHHERELTRELTTTEATHMLDMLSLFFPSRITNVKSRVIDGMPSTLTVYRREPYLVVAAKCNIFEWRHPDTVEELHPDSEVPPVAKIGIWLLDIERMELGDD